MRPTNKKKNEKPAGPARVIGYVRVSTEGQADRGSSLEAQEAKLRRQAELLEVELVAIEVDAGASASTLKRPGLQRALARLDAFEAEGLLVTKLDRLTRSVRDLGDLIDTYFKDGQHALMSASEQIDTRSAAGRMMLNVLTSIAQWEREAIGERTSAVMQHLKECGKFTGGWPPYGWAVDEDGALVASVEEQAVITRVRGLHAAGRSLRTIADEVGPNRRTGKAFDHKQISRMMCG